MSDHPLKGVQALLFDVFGTVVNYHGSIAEHIIRKAGDKITKEDAATLTDQWRKLYYRDVWAIAGGGEGSAIADVLHRQGLDELLASERWAHLGAIWNDEDRKELVLGWHQLEGWPDSSEGLHKLKKNIIIGTNSNGNVRLLVDMAKYADLPWDVVFSSEMVGTFKPNPKMYLAGVQYLSLKPNQVAMVAAHVGDLRGAAAAGLKTVYVPRVTEDKPEVAAGAKEKKDGGEIDVIVRDLVHLADIVAGLKQ